MGLPICASLLALIAACSSTAAEVPSEPAKAAVVPSSQLRIIDRPDESAAASEAAPSAAAVLPPAAPTLRDPTQPSAQMKAVLGQRAGPGPGAPAKLPAPRIKGRVASPDGGILVLLQVGEQLERVSAGAEWTTEDGLTIQVLSVSLTELRLQIQPLNRILTVR